MIAIFCLSRLFYFRTFKNSERKTHKKWEEICSII